MDSNTMPASTDVQLAVLGMVTAGWPDLVAELDVHDGIGTYAGSRTEHVTEGPYAVKITLTIELSERRSWPGGERLRVVAAKEPEPMATIDFQLERPPAPFARWRGPEFMGESGFAPAEHGTVIANPTVPNPALAVEIAALERKIAAQVELQRAVAAAEAARS